MSTKKQRVALSDAQLEANIDRIVEIRPMANEYKTLLNDVKAELGARKIQRWTAPSGNRAEFGFTPIFGWLLEGLKNCLPRGVFELLCPRKADAKKLNQRLAATPEDKKLAACKVKVSQKVELFILAHNETANVTQLHTDDEEESEAA